MKADSLGIYVHIPFCVRKCNYCDFCSKSPASTDEIDSYINTLCEEISKYKEEVLSCDSVFFGGGTPSLLSGRQFSKIASSIKSTFNLSDDTEFTIEANPKTLTEGNLIEYINAGVNRISLGLQTIHENELKILGRIHTYPDFLESYNLIRKCGIKNVNVDLMYGLPEQTLKSFEETLENVSALSPEHISVYGLILEEGTPLYKMKNELVFPTEDEEYEMYMLADRTLTAKGYSHYEISNYSLNGKSSRHNLKYWRCLEYLGFGVSAYSYFKSRRFGNSLSLSEYSAGNGECYNTEIIGNEDSRFERIMLGLRLSEGISLSDYKRDFGRDFLLDNSDKLTSLSMQGYLTISDERVALTPKGFYVSNYIINELTESS